MKKIHYIGGGDGLAAVYIIDGSDNGEMYYVSKDYLGSIMVLTDENGAVAEEYSYDAWGRRRNPTNWWSYLVSAPTILYRGYTGHEHLDEFALINMNGRIYDPLTGRFLSPDNYIQAPGYTQSYNRYTYCLNNPLIYTDPDGEFFFIALLTCICPILAPVGIILDAACWGGAIDLGIQYARYSSGKQDHINWAEVGGAAVSGAVFGTMGLLSPSFDVTSTEFKDNIKVYLKKAGYASLTGIVTSGSGMLATDLFDNGQIDHSGRDYLETMGVAGLTSFALSFAGSMYDYYSWDRYNRDEKIERLNERYFDDKGVVIYDENVNYAHTRYRKQLDLETGNWDVSYTIEVNDELLKSRAYTLSVIRSHEKVHYKDLFRIGYMPEIRGYKNQMRMMSIDRVSINQYLKIIEYAEDETMGNLKWYRAGFYFPFFGF